MSHRLSTIEAAVEAIAAGKVVIVMDAEDRENEGDFICAAEKVTPEIVNFMITHGRGQLCMPILPEVCRAARSAADGREQHGPAARRPSPCRSITAAAARASPPRSGRRRSGRSSTRRASRPISSGPGHLYPAGGQGRRRAAPRRAHRGRRRSGPHGRPEAGRRAHAKSSTRTAIGPTASELYELAEQFDLEIITIEELIRYRRRSEKLVYRLAEAESADAGTARAGSSPTA